MTRAAFVALLLVARLAHAQAADRLVLTRDDIQASGWQRVSELLDAVGWRLTSTDGLTITPTADGFPAPGASGIGVSTVTTIVDGVPTPLDLLGQEPLELSPVLLSQLDSVVFSAEPRFTAATLAMRGTIEFFSRRPPAGASGKGAFQVGDVGRKPGLYQYTPRRPVNREHQGPFHHLLFGYGGSRGGIEAGYRFATLNTTDSLLQSRTTGGLTVGTAQINVATPVVHAMLDAFGGRHDFDATRAHYSGLYFVPALGHEQSLRIYATSAGGGGSVRAPDDVTLTYAARYTADDVEPLYSPSPSTVTHRRRNTLLSAGASRRLGEVLASLDAASERWSLDRWTGGASSVTSARASGTLSYGSTAWTLTAGAGASEVSSTWSGFGALTLARSWTQDRVTLSGSTAPESPLAGSGWIDARVLGFASTPAATRISTAAATWTHNIAPVALFLSGRIANAPAWPVAVPSDTGSFELRGEAPPTPVPSLARNTAATIGVESAPQSNARLRLAYSYVTAIGGDSLARLASQSLPHHQLNGIAWFTPSPDWRVSTLVQVVSSSHWAAFPSIRGGWPPDVAGFSRVDAGVEKWLWQRRFRLQYQVRDLLNQSERWQPRSVQFNLRWMGTASFELH